MAAIRRRDTKPEVAVRSALHRSGLRFRKDLPVRVEGRIIRPDIVFTRRRLAVFIDGCFWHCCPTHGRQPRANIDYWSEKLARNAARDAWQSDALRREGWQVIRFWEHEGIPAIAGSIGGLVEQVPVTMTAPHD